MKKKKGTFHGITSLLLLLIAFLIGFFQVYRFSHLYALVYAGFVLVGIYLLIKVFCTKCPCKEFSCAHLFPGFIARFLPKKEEGNYKNGEIALVVVTVIIWIGFPIYWLQHNFELMILFLFLFVTAFYQIVRFVCTKCDNAFCPAKKIMHEDKK